MLANEQVHTFVSDVLDTYHCGEVPDTVDSLGFFLEAFHALEAATLPEAATRPSGHGERYLEEFAEKYMHLGQS